MSQFELNKGDNFIFAVDVSASMNTKDCPNNTTRIEYLKEQVTTFAREASKWDDDGIDVLTYGERVTPFKNVTSDNAADIISKLSAKEGMTDTAAVIAKAFELHRAGNYPQTLLLLATDGAPSDREAVKNQIRRIASEIRDEHEFAISILTVGEIDTSLRSFLTELDDDLKAKHDIVDVKALADVDFLAAFSGALHD